MNWEQGPAWLTVAAVWSYWLGVLFMAARARLKGASSAGLVPGQALERVMWLVWVPVIAGWILFPWFSITQGSEIWHPPRITQEVAVWLGLRWAAGVLTLVCLGATVYCWRWMGRNWRVGVTRDDRTELVTGGPFSLVRHPIYSVSILMMLCTLVAVPTWPLTIAALLHVILMNLKARNEERWMVELHGQAYLDYRKRTGRLVPLWGRGQHGPTATR